MLHAPNTFFHSPPQTHYDVCRWGTKHETARLYRRLERRGSGMARRGARARCRPYLPSRHAVPLSAGSRESVGIVDALMDELRRNGFVEGQNLVVEYRAWAAHLDLISDYTA